MEENEREFYLKAYYDNEFSANKHMSIANAFAAILMLVIHIMYLTGAFQIRHGTLTVVNIVFPISVLILLTPLIYTKFAPKFLRKPRYKYFVVSSFVLVIAAINVVIPKHAVLGWALLIFVTNHYYNPKLGLTTYLTVLGLMFICLYAGMFLGEYDPNLLGNGVIIDGKIVYVDGPQERFNMLHQMIQEGENRYLRVFLYYYIPRSAIISLIFFVSYSLNKRTYKLLMDEIKVNSTQEKAKTELEVAKEIQLATLPKKIISNDNVEIQAELKAAKEVGGDFYDYFVLDEDNVAVVIGDVSGKGVPAAMFMMQTITCFKNCVSLDKTPAAVLKEVNKTIYEGNESKMFVTCFLAIINTKTGIVKYANAGHNPPIIGQKQHYRYLLTNPGFILGGMPEAFVQDEMVKIKSGDTLTLYTDGITEAMNNNREQYGDKRLLELFNKKEYSSLSELHQCLKDDVMTFVDGAPQSDDMTYITIKVNIP